MVHLAHDCRILVFGHTLVYLGYEMNVNATGTLIYHVFFFSRLQELVKRCVGQEQAENKDTDNLVQETDSQYGTWETGLRTDER